MQLGIFFFFVVYQILQDSNKISFSPFAGFSRNSSQRRLQPDRRDTHSKLDVRLVEEGTQLTDIIRTKHSLRHDVCMVGQRHVPDLV